MTISVGNSHHSSYVAAPLAITNLLEGNALWLAYAVRP